MSNFRSSRFKLPISNIYSILLKLMHCVHLESVDSTHLWARRSLDELQLPAMVSATQQTAGVGQGSHSWYSEAGDLMVTFVHHCPPEGQPFITSLLARSCMLLCQEYGFETTFVFPNDMFLQGQKVAGVLTTITHNDLAINSLGLNIHMQETVCASIEPPAISWHMASRGQTYSLSEVRSRLRSIYCSEIGRYPNLGMQLCL